MISVRLEIETMAENEASQNFAWKWKGDIWNPIKMLVDQMSLLCNIYVITLNKNTCLLITLKSSLYLTSIVQSGMEESNLKKC